MNTCRLVHLFAFFFSFLFRCGRAKKNSGNFTCATWDRLWGGVHMGIWVIVPNAFLGISHLLRVYLFSSITPGGIKYFFVPQFSTHTVLHIMDDRICTSFELIALREQTKTNKPFSKTNHSRIIGFPVGLSTPGNAFSNKTFPGGDKKKKQ